MCGIVGYVGHRPAQSVVLDGLTRLEYRGYDSAGIVVSSGDGRLEHVKKAGKLRVLAEALAESPLRGTIAIGHTRWATHGRPSDDNAHPHLDEASKIALVHNGIIENHATLRERLLASGHTFTSETDSEVLVHLIDEAYDGDLVAAVRRALRQVEGAYAVVVTHADHLEVVAARVTSPLVVGLGDDETFVASDVPALLPYTRRVVYLDDGEIAVVGGGAVRILDRTGLPTDVAEDTVDWDPESAEKGGWPHFMLKEIFEQPESLERTIASRVSVDGRAFDLGLALSGTDVDRVVITAAGTASYAGEVGRTLIGRWARLPCEVIVASEFRYGEPVVDGRTLVVAVSQSGETIDTLEAVREAKRRGARTLGIVNVKGSSIAREVHDVTYVHAGPEIGVASTKAYTAMIAAFTLLALSFARDRGTLSEPEIEWWARTLRSVPDAVRRTLGVHDRVRSAARWLAPAKSALFLGRGVNVASAYEGALKVKEITYLHAEAYPTGEMKHGPIALIDASVPTVVVAVEGPFLAKTLSNVREIQARDGGVLAIVTEGDEEAGAVADLTLEVPRVPELLSPFVVAVALQLLAYETAVALGRDVDQPRNLAKSVTVE